MKDPMRIKERTCHFCNTTYVGKTRFHQKPCCLNCQPMMRKAYKDADTTRWYLEQGIDQLALREAARASGREEKFGGYRPATYKIGE